METEKEEKRIQLERRIEEQEDTIWRIDRTLRDLEEHNQQAIWHMNNAAALCQPGDFMYDQIMTMIQDVQRGFENGKDTLLEEKRTLSFNIEEAEYSKAHIDAGK